MGSIVEKKRTDQATGKTVTQYRAHIRRAGFASPPSGHWPFPRNEDRTSA